jgi:ubiquinone/menaquinone biosynthesis C-methylase UbiE
MALTNRVVFNPTVWKVGAKYWYPLVTRHLGSDEVLFLNNGYEEDPPLGLPLSADDEPYRAAIQLYHRTATQTDLAGKRVLEVSSGHGGGASYLTRTLGPASYTGLDLNPAGVAFCRERHQLPGLEFVRGNAEDLPFAAQTYDAVINVEASHCYPHLDVFLREVARVLAPGGHFLYADVRRHDRVAEWDAALAAAPLRLVSQRDINPEVLRGLEISSAHAAELVSRKVPAFLRRFGRDGVGVEGSGFYRALKKGEFTWRMYDLIKD